MSEHDDILNHFRDETSQALLRATYAPRSRGRSNVPMVTLSVSEARLLQEAITMLREVGVVSLKFAAEMESSTFAPIGAELRRRLEHLVVD